MRASWWWSLVETAAVAVAAGAAVALDFRDFAMNRTWLEGRGRPGRTEPQLAGWSHDQSISQSAPSDAATSLEVILSTKSPSEQTLDHSRNARWQCTQRA